MKTKKIVSLFALVVFTAAVGSLFALERAWEQPPTASLYFAVIASDSSSGVSDATHPGSGGMHSGKGVSNVREWEQKDVSVYEKLMLETAAIKGHYLDKANKQLLEIINTPDVDKRGLMGEVMVSIMGALTRLSKYLSVPEELKEDHKKALNFLSIAEDYIDSTDYIEDEKLTEFAGKLKPNVCGAIKWLDIMSINAHKLMQGESIEDIRKKMERHPAF